MLLFPEAAMRSDFITQGQNHEVKWKEGRTGGHNSKNFFGLRGNNLRVKWGEQRRRKSVVRLVY
jgi:hypothetical protein